MRLLLRWDTLDNPYFPRHGLRVQADAFFGNRSTTYGGVEIYDDSSSRAGVFANGAFSLGANDFVNVAVRAGGITSNNEKADPISDFNLGGFLNLSGYRTDQASGNYVAFARAVYYHRVGTLPVIGRGIYVGGSLEAGNVWDTRSEFERFNVVPAGSVFLAADTRLGPFYLAYGRTSHGNQSFYLVLGRP